VFQIVAKSELCNWLRHPRSIVRKVNESEARATVQTTLQNDVVFYGCGLHTGRPTSVHVHPAAASTGIVFRRTDLVGVNTRVAAHWDNVIVSPLNTRLTNEDGVTVSTIEHLMAALAGCGIHNARVDIDGPEVPIMDGSAAAFVRGFLKAGVIRLDAPLRAIEILDVVSVQVGEASARLSPATSLQIDFAIDFADSAIGHQSKTLNLANGTFVRELCDSRTFCRSSDVAAMRANGLALGGTLENAVVVDGAEVLTPGGLRHRDEAVRHKMLDALGDLYTAGAPILGRYTGRRAGHAVTNNLLQALFDTPKAWRWVNCDAQIAARLPGVGVSVADLHAVA
jgi:UDP-3-O-[3-hydroxymyristoyl] N-acetylglucosamine deacetylase